MLTEKTKRAGTRPLLRFLIPSALGAFFFLLPVRYEGGWTIPMGALSALLTESVGEYMPFIVLAIVVVSALLSVWYSLIKRPPQDGYSGLRLIFFVSRGWLLLRLAGTVVTILIFFELGPGFIWADATGNGPPTSTVFQTRAGITTSGQKFLVTRFPGLYVVAKHLDVLNRDGHALARSLDKNLIEIGRCLLN